MKPLFLVALCVALALGHPDNIAEVEELSQGKEPVLEAEESDPQSRAERCTTCGTAGFDIHVKSPNEILAQIQALPGAEVHTQQSFEGCSSDKGCAGLKVKDGRVIEKFGNIDAFRAAAASDTTNEFNFHPGGAFGVNVFEGGIPKDGPFWWMNQNSPFKNAAAGGGSFEKFSKSSSSFSSSGTTGAGGGLNAGASGANFGASIDLSANPFLNGDFSKLAGAAGFSNAAGGIQEAAASRPNSFSQSSFESSSFSSSNKGELDLSNNPFLNGGLNKAAGGQAGQSGFQAQAAFGSGSTGFGSSQFGANQGFGANNFGANGAAGSNANSFAANSAGSNSASGFQSGFSGNKFSATGYTGSSPSPFTASAGGANVNLIQNTQKTSEFDFEQQQQTQSNIDEAFQGTGNVHAHEHSGGELQQTCAGQGYICVHKAQCNNGVVNTNGAGILQAKTKKQYCNTRTEVCCRIEISTLAGAGGLQGSLGVGSATFSGSGSQGSGLFVSQSGQSSGSNFAGQAGQNGVNGASGANGFGATGSFGSSSTNFESTQTSFGNRQAQPAGSGVGTAGFGATFGVNSGTTGSSGNFGGNRGVTVESSSSTFETSSRGGFGGNNNKFGSTGGFEAGFGAGNQNANTNTRLNGNSFNNDAVYKATSQSNFIETDTFSAGNENVGVYRPGSVGAGLKPGIPYLPPVDTSNAGSSVVSSTAFPTPTFVTTRRPFTTPRPTYLPPVPSTSAPGYLPPPEGEQTINKETRLPFPPTYDEGQIILDETRPRPIVPVVPLVTEVPVGCAAALKCTPIEFCTAEGVISNTTVVLSRAQEEYRVPLTDCKDLETGRVGKCCRDPTYTDPWPTNQLGKWVPGVFGGNDGKYVADSRGSPSNRPTVTVRPDVTGSVLLNNFRSTPKPTTPPFGVNQVTPGFPSTTFGQKGQFEVRGQGSYAQGGQGQFAQGGQGQFVQGGQGQYALGGQGQQGQTQFTQASQVTQTASSTFGQRGQSGIVNQGQGTLVNQGQGGFVSRGQGTLVNQGQGTLVSQGQGAVVSRGEGQLVSQGQGAFVSRGEGALVSQGQGALVSQGQGALVSQGQGQFAQQGVGQFAQGGNGQFGLGAQGQQAGLNQFTQTQKAFSSQTSQGGAIQNQRAQGQAIINGQGQAISQGFGTGVRQGQGFAVSQGSGFEVERESGESLQRVFLSQYNAGGSCGLLNGQKPYGNRNELEVDFAEIPWQAMVLLQTNKSLLCGGVITRPDVVVTTASCVEGLQAKNVLIKGGEWKLGIDDEPLPFQIVQVKNILRHPFYNRANLQNDAAILVLSENLRLAKNIYPICLPGQGETLDAFYNGAGECIVTGWGKQVLQAHLAGAIMHSINISLINPGECQEKLAQDYPHLLEQYDQESCACGQPTNPINNVCRVDIGSALACTTGDGHFVFRGVYSWDSGCQPGNQLAAFYKFDLEWYLWAIGLLESARFAQFGGGAQFSQQRFSGQLNGVKGGQFASGIKGGQFSSGFSSSQFASSKYQSSSSESASGAFNGQIKAPITNSFSAAFAEKKTYKTQPQIITYTTKPEIVTFTTKPEIFTYTTKPKIVTFTTKPQIITYDASGSGKSPQYTAPGVSFNPSLTELVGAHSHTSTCKCLENGKK